jgi:hypothetical protein
MEGKTWVMLGCALGLGIVGCRSGPAPEVPQQFQGRALYACCNLHYESGDLSDANYWTGKTLKAGTPVVIEKLGKDSVTFAAGDVHLKLTHQYGTKEESFAQYFGKILVADDPRPRIAAYRPAVQRAIENSKAERGMTREQVLTSLGYPPTHKTPSINDREWTYWYNHWVTFKVVFDDAGKVSEIVGHPAPTAEAPIEDAAKPAPPQKKKHKPK